MTIHVPLQREKSLRAQERMPRILDVINRMHCHASVIWMACTTRILACISER